MLVPMQFAARVRDRIRERGPKAFGRALRLTGAAVAAYLVAEWLFPGGRSVLAPLTALLVVQVTLTSTLTSGLQRIASVVIGVVGAVLFADLVALSWWSLAVLVAAAIFVGQLLRLREHMLEVPISAMLVLAVGGAEAKATARITETLVGAAVGILYNILLPGPVQSNSAASAVQELADEIAALLQRMGAELRDGITVDRASRWLEDARDLPRRVSRVDQVLVQAEESRRLNVRAFGTLDPTDVLHSGLDALEHSSVALRSLCRAVADQARAASDDEDGYSADIRAVFGVLLDDLATAMAAFGRLVQEDAEGEAQAQGERLARALDAVREARVRLTELLLIDREGDQRTWELHGVLLANVQRILGEIDVEERVRQRERQRQQWAARPPAAHVVDRLRTTSREVVRPVRRRWRRRIPEDSR